MFVWRSAVRLPSVIDPAASAHTIGCQAVSVRKNPKKIRLRMATNPPAFDATDKNAVTGVGDPSYVSGAQKWKGTALILKANPTSVRKIATAKSAGRFAPPPYSPMPRNNLDPDKPKNNHMPYNITADDRTPNR